MKIIGIGLPRTGNTSLSKALTMLGFEVRHYVPDMLEFSEAIQSYDAIVDFPAQIMFPYIMNRFPKCLGIMTVRSDTASQYQSLMNHCDSVMRFKENRTEVLRVHQLIYGNPEPSIHDVIDAQSRLDEMADPFVRAGRILRLEVKSSDKMKQLTEFIGVESDCVYPHEGSSLPDGVVENG